MIRPTNATDFYVSTVKTQEEVAESQSNDTEDNTGMVVYLYPSAAFFRLKSTCLHGFTCKWPHSEALGLRDYRLVVVHIGLLGSPRKGGSSTNTLPATTWSS